MRPEFLVRDIHLVNLGPGSTLCFFGLRIAGVKWLCAERENEACWFGVTAANARERKGLATQTCNAWGDETITLTCNLQQQPFPSLLLLNFLEYQGNERQVQTVRMYYRLNCLKKALPSFWEVERFYKCRPLVGCSAFSPAACCCRCSLLIRNNWKKCCHLGKTHHVDTGQHIINRVWRNNYSVIPLTTRGNSLIAPTTSSWSSNAKNRRYFHTYFSY